MYKSISLWLTSSRFDIGETISPNATKESHTTASPASSITPIVHLNLGVVGQDVTHHALEDMIERVKKFASKASAKHIKIESEGKPKSTDKKIVVGMKKNSALKTLCDELSKEIEIKPEDQITLCLGKVTKEIESALSKFGSFVLEVDGIDVVAYDQCSCHDIVQIGRSLFQGQIFMRSSLFINGRWCSPQGQGRLPVFNPANGRHIHSVGSGSSRDIEAAVNAAKKSFKEWSSMSPEDRAKIIHRIAEIIESRKEEFVRMEILDNGKPYREALADVEDTIQCFHYYANLCVKFFANQGVKIDVEDSSVDSQYIYEAIGVSGLIIPWNYPLLMATWKVAPCLAAGSTCILKPSELTPLSALELAAVSMEAGLPPGVLNIVTGFGPDTGTPLATHPLVDKVAFTGSVPTGSHVMSDAALSVKVVSLELGGKSPAIVCQDADIDQAVDWLTVGIFYNAGQVCSATSRLLVHESIHDTLVERLVQVSNKIVIGDGNDQKTQLGPLVSKGQWQRVRNYIELGKKQGATLKCGGDVPSVQTGGEVTREDGGYYLQPTIFTDVKSHMTIWKEEIFGPVLCVMPFRTEDEALELANDTDYGLAAAVFSKNDETCQRISRALKSGIVWVNCSQPTYCQAPWGGYKKSGVGRELGVWGLKNYLEVKQITTWVDDKQKGWNWYGSKL